MSIDYGRAEYEAEVRERDRLMAEIERRGLRDRYIRLEIENEGWDGEPSLQAGAMRKLLGRRYASTPTSNGFPARFTGTCNRCRERIVPGQYIRSSLGRYAHTECPSA